MNDKVEMNDKELAELAAKTFELLGAETSALIGVEIINRYREGKGKKRHGLLDDIVSLIKWRKLTGR